MMTCNTISNAYWTFENFGGEKYMKTFGQKPTFYSDLSMPFAFLEDHVSKACEFESATMNLDFSG